MRLWTLDYETFFGDGYTLSGMTTEEYIRDPRFRAHGMGVRDPAGAYYWVTHNDLPAFFASNDWTRDAVLAQHAQFEALIASHHYGVHPSMWLDTRAMGNLLLPRQKKSLAKIAEFYGLPEKTVPYNLFRNIRELPPHIELQVAAGCLDDVRLNHAIFINMLQGANGLPPFPPAELPIISETIRMFGSPVLHIDISRAAALADRIAARKETTLEALGVDREVLASRECFAELLRELGVDPPVKISPTTKEETYDFNKNSAAVKDLLESDNETVATLMAARLGVSSTIGETRARRFAATAMRGQPVPVYLNYNSTFSCRWSGGDSMNWQNLERLPNRDETGEFTKGADGYVKKGELRLCVMAPPGYRLVIADLSQIEARLLAWHAGQHDLVEAFRAGRDVYSEFIEPYYGYPISKKTPSERGVGKASILSMGYQAGDATIKHTLALGTYGPPLKLPLEECGALKNYYRTRNNKICGQGGHWTRANNAIEILARKGKHDWGPAHINNGRIWLPGGIWLDYTSLGRMDDEWRVTTARGSVKIYSGKVTAHVNSALARVVLTDAMKLIAPRWRIASTCHDELVCCVPEDDAERCARECKEIMEQRVWWAPDLPVECEVEIDRVYSK